jgi:hypothetical protein
MWGWMLIAAASTSTTSTVTASAADLELARHLDVLENWELFRDLEIVELLPLMEEDAP